jgi:hypothetical protein
VGFIPLSGTIATVEDIGIPFGTAAPNEIRLTCKVVSWNEIPLGYLSDGNTKTDVVEDDGLDERSHYLILGNSRRNGDYLVALKVIEAGGSRIFRRIGHAELRTFEALARKEPRSVSLL